MNVHVKLATNCAMTSIAVCNQSIAGDLAPPAGPIAPTQKTLDQVEPRIPLTQQTAPGDTNSIFRVTEPGSGATSNIVGSDPFSNLYD